MSCNNVEAGHIMWILYWWHRFPFSHRQWGLGVGVGDVWARERKKEKKDHNSHQSHQNTEWFPAKLITLYPTLDNNARSCLSKQYYSISVRLRSSARVASYFDLIVFSYWMCSIASTIERHKIIWSFQLNHLRWDLHIIWRENLLKMLNT